MMDLSVLLSTYRRPAILKETLESFCVLNTQGISWKILIADNADDPETQKVLKSFHKKLPLDFIVVTKPGKNAALNELLKLAKGELYVFTDDDVTPDPDWLIELWHAAKRWPSDILFGGKIIPLFPSNTPDWMKDPSFQSASLAFAKFDKGNKEKPFEDCPLGPNMAVKREVFTKYKFSFDEHIGPCGYDYPMGSETSFCRKLKKFKKRYIYVPKAIVYHRIRKDQVTFKSLLKRVYKSGRGFVAENPYHDCKELYGVPRYLYKRIFVLLLRYIINIWKPDHKKWIYAKDLYFHLGMFKQYRIHAKATNK